MDTRYQHQSWLVRRWRDRYLLTVPFKAVTYWIHELRRPLWDEDDWKMSFRGCWGLALGMAQASQQHWYYGTELNEDFSLKPDGQED